MSITVDGDVVTGERLIHGIDSKKGLPCEFRRFHELCGTPIGEAKWRIFWNLNAGWCLCTALCRWSMACDACKVECLNSLGLQCRHCKNIVTMGEAILRIEAL